jgi:hypothetical protein
MPFIGNQPAKVPLTSADITDGIITNADISATAAIALTKLASTGTLTVDNIQFPATAVASANANNLDDYEEGTWTPQISGGTTAGTGTYAVQNGRYTKIGNQVTICCYMNITAHTGTGLMRLSNFPFTILNVTNLFQGVSIGLFKNVTLPASSIPYAYAVFNTTLANVQSIPLGGGGTTDVSVDGSCEISFSLTYLT